MKRNSRRYARWVVAASLLIPIAVSLLLPTAGHDAVTTPSGAFDVTWMIRRERSIIHLAKEERVTPDGSISPAAAGAILAELARLEPTVATAAHAGRSAKDGVDAAWKLSILVQMDSILPLAATNSDHAMTAFLRSLRNDSAYRLISKLARARSADLVGAAFRISEPMSRMEQLPYVGLNGLDHTHAITFGVAAGYLTEGRTDEALSTLRQLLTVDLLIIDSSVYDVEVLLAARHLERTLRGLAFVYWQAGAQVHAERLQADLRAATASRKYAVEAWAAAHQPTLGDVEALLNEPGSPRSVAWHVVLVSGSFAACRPHEQRERARHLAALRERLARTAAERALFDEATRPRLRDLVHACARWY